MTIEFEIEKTDECVGFTWPVFSALKNHIYDYYEHEQFYLDFNSMHINTRFPINTQPKSVYSWGLLKLIFLGVNEGEFTPSEIRQIIFQLEEVPLPEDECLKKQLIKLYKLFCKAHWLKSYIIIS